MSHETLTSNGGQLSEEGKKLLEERRIREGSNPTRSPNVEKSSGGGRVPGFEKRTNPFK